MFFGGRSRSNKSERAAEYGHQKVAAKGRAEGAKRYGGVGSQRDMCRIIVWFGLIEPKRIQKLSVCFDPCPDSKGCLASDFANARCLCDPWYSASSRREKTHIFQCHQLKTSRLMGQD